MAPRKEVHTGDMHIEQPKDIVLGDGTLARGGVEIETVTDSLGHDHAAALAFMEEELLVVVMEVEDPHAENPVTVGNNGIFKQFYRGKPTLAKRKFVDCLIVKSGRVTTPEVQNGGGERTYAIRQTSAHKYPFSVLEDRNPKGKEWLVQRMAEAI